MKPCTCGKPAVIKYRSPAIERTYTNASFKKVTAYDPPEVDGAFCEDCFVATIKARRPAARAAMKARKMALPVRRRSEIDLGPCGCCACVRDRVQRSEAAELREWRKPDQAALSLHRTYAELRVVA